ncbi:dolichyl-diphosphooligosaccharide--protein glycosyltransferase subunit 2 [Anaeramoeba ignava]|uniref:Ribophorin II n=1 Tax=Anaeramoeba ignava TaxID=1746090 RepID=A0A9Q0LRZ5_ANAIG|nr:dolichyl-diphosphooligosaccharide--protein glycosyltransferase subunit 2 [Anaeramoeba ignava]
MKISFNFLIVLFLIFSISFFLTKANNFASTNVLKEKELKEIEKITKKAFKEKDIEKFTPQNLFYSILTFKTLSKISTENKPFETKNFPKNLPISKEKICKFVIEKVVSDYNFENVDKSIMELKFLTEIYSEMDCKAEKNANLVIPKRTISKLRAKLNSRNSEVISNSGITLINFIKFFDVEKSREEIIPKIMTKLDSLLDSLEEYDENEEDNDDDYSSYEKHSYQTKDSEKLATVLELFSKINSDLLKKENEEKNPESFELLKQRLKGVIEDISDYIVYIEEEIEDEDLSELLIKTSLQNSASFHNRKDNPDPKITSTILNALCVIKDVLEIDIEPRIFSDSFSNEIANFFLSFKTSKEISLISQMLSSLALINSRSDIYIKPVAVTVVDGDKITLASSQAKGSKIDFFVSDLFANEIEGISEVFVNKIVRIGEHKSQVLSNLKLESAKKNIFEFDFLSSKPMVGIYKTDLKIEHILEDKSEENEEKESRTIYSSILLKVVGPITVSDIEISVSDKITTRTTKFRSVFPEPISGLYEIDSSKQTEISLKIYNLLTTQYEFPHQVMLRLTKIQEQIDSNEAEKNHKFSQKENPTYYLTMKPIADILRTEIKKKSKFNYVSQFSFQEIASQFLMESGKYSMELIVGDFFTEKPITWFLSEIYLNFENVSITSEEYSKSKEFLFSAKPEIWAKTPEEKVCKERFISKIFAIIVLIPSLFLIVFLFKIGINFGNFPSLLKDGLIPFVLNNLFVIGLFLVGYVLVMLWIQFDIFQTTLYLFFLTLLLGFTGIFGFQKKQKVD